MEVDTSENCGIISEHAIDVWNSERITKNIENSFIDNKYFFIIQLTHRQQR